MSETTVRTRSDIPDRYKWNAESVFTNAQAWSQAADALQKRIPELEKFQGRLSEDPAVLVDAFNLLDQLYREVGKIYVYAAIEAAVDTGDQEAQRKRGRALGIFGQFIAAASFLDPELLAVGQETLKRWLKEEPKLAIFEHYISNLFRKQEHVRSAEVEELLGMLAEPFSGPGTLNTLMTDADFKFRNAVTNDEKEIPVTQGTIEEILAGPDREARRTAWNSYMDTYLAFKNSLAGNLDTSIRMNVFQMRARRHKTTLEASLFENNIPVEVFHNLIEVFKKNLPTWHRYWAIRRMALGVDKLAPYDIWAPLTESRPKISYDQAVEMITEGLKPMGEEYVAQVRKGCTEERWIDVYPNQGKSSAQFSAGWPGTHPFIVINYDDTIFSLSTMAHELGHSMHSFLTWENQPFVYSDYSLFVAEVASNFHQAMVRAHLLNSTDDKQFQINVIEEAMSNFHRYFFIMPTLARFELEMHQKAENGEGLTAEDMINRMTELFEEGYGGEMEIDHDRVGITWATFGHLFADYYVYQYATGISAANALASRILNGEQGAVDRYLDFLKTGSSVYPLDALQIAGVDMRTPKAVEEGFAVLAGLVDRLEKLVG